MPPAVSLMTTNAENLTPSGTYVEAARTPHQAFRRGGWSGFEAPEEDVGRALRRLHRTMSLPGRPRTFSAFITHPPP